MARPKGSVNKPKSPLEEKGNPDFNVSLVEPSVTLGEEVAVGAITDADYELDRQLEAMARDAEPDISDRDNTPVMRKTVEPYTLLSEFIPAIQPAKTLNELEDQVFRAKSCEADSIEATPEILKYFLKKAYPPKSGYMIYKDIKVYMPDFFEQSVKRDKETVEFRNFGGSKIDIGGITNTGPAKPA